MYGSKSNSEKATQMLRQTAGTIERTIQMIQDDTYCIDIIQQIDSMTGTLKKAKIELLSGHLESCLKREMDTDGKKTISELMKVYKLTS